MHLEKNSANPSIARISVQDVPHIEPGVDENWGSPEMLLQFQERLVTGLCSHKVTLVSSIAGAMVLLLRQSSKLSVGLSYNSSNSPWSSSSQACSSLLSSVPSQLNSFATGFFTRFLPTWQFLHGKDWVQLCHSDIILI
ncbi:hypothetical protein OS493_002995 [Desmophyllum pertusum]|uniref:Uncharacterized protein n=1 Tax=Desmophyllum pertusum TaxID=174260 RepID=A0A9W9YJR7_9CNID|nr:hypothetical protein OS493_002995 [Desmophyllum pertusum]